jgi:hypothetical protein
MFHSIWPIYNLPWQIYIRTERIPHRHDARDLIYFPLNCEAKVWILQQHLLSSIGLCVLAPEVERQTTYQQDH